MFSLRFALAFPVAKRRGGRGGDGEKGEGLHADLVRLKEVRGTCRSEIGTRMMIQRHMICLLEHDSRQVKSRCPMNRNVFRWRFLFFGSQMDGNLPSSRGC
jgi:hypothetical protein